MSEMRIRSMADYRAAYQRSTTDPEGFWADVAAGFRWRSPWAKVLKWDFAKADTKWFIGGRLNITENCLDRHLAERGEMTALLWEPNDPAQSSEHISYRQLHERVCRMANVLKRQGVKKGDRVCLYMPMIPELAISVLACARIGAIHSVVFGGFSANSLVDRINDSQCVMVITSDGIRRGAKSIPAKPVVDEALPSCPSVKTVLVAKCTGEAVSMRSGRDLWLEDEWRQVDADCPALLDHPASTPFFTQR